MSWSSRFPAYQIDFQAAASGKRVASTKRRVRWRFGYPNVQALDAGRTGIDCRGEEHDIVIVWSITSGKRQVTMDGQEVHFSISRSGVLEHSWSAKGNHVMKVIAHAAPPLTATPGFLQYDFLIDGQSFFQMPKVYELGVRRPGPNYERSPGAVPNRDRGDHGYGNGGYGNGGAVGYGNTYSSRIANVPRTREEEDAELRRAINASLEESKKYLENKQPVDDRSAASAPEPSERGTNEDLLGFGADTVSVNTPRAATTDAHSVMSFSSMPPPQQYAPFAGAPQAGQPPPSSYPAQPPSVYAPPTYPAPAPSTYAQPPTSSYPPPANPSYPVPPAQNGPVLQLTNGPTGAPAYGGPPPPAPMPAYQSAPPQAYPPQTAAPPGQPIDAFAPPAPSTDVFNLHQPPPVDDPFAPKPPPPPTQNDIHNAILGAYGGQPPQGPPQPGVTPGAPPGAQAGQPMPAENGGSAQTNGSANNAQLTITGGLSMNGYVETAEEEPQSEYDAALKNLVNIDRIDEPVDKVMTLEMKKQLEEEERQKNKGRSKPLPPAAHGMVGSQASLQQIQVVKPQKAPPKEEVMKPPPQLFHPNAAMAGALVVHGQGPPPLQQPQGFGAGYRMHHGQQYRS